MTMALVVISHDELRAKVVFGNGNRRSHTLDAAVLKGVLVVSLVGRWNSRAATVGFTSQENTSSGDGL